MTTAQNIEMTFYQNLGKLFYAIAASDRVVRESEYKSLRKIVKSEWLKLDEVEDEFGADAAYQIEIVFDWLDYQELDAQEAYDQFEAYYNDHKTHFTTKIKELVWSTCNVIAGAFSGKNKSELMMLGRLKLIFEK
ncbi:hypothetical protein U6A24_06020 [Aquimarina gracilis]|uniref:Tellurite resistance protein TerB n=1 Tax=Aquimarina gracilis TaxID=874422 RepID=A0ABU5ZT92_9FLAO|nr:hypothetical protein [Aquimarina gracilis]MEB3345006.1 hypothetical protein [Aquimarina gracilis]